MKLLFFLLYLLDGELDRIGGRSRAQVVHARLEALLPGIKVHRRELGKGGLGNVDVERL